METPKQAIIRYTVYLLLFFLVFVLPFTYITIMGGSYPTYEELGETTAYPLGIRMERKVQRFADEITYYLKTSEGEFVIRGEYDKDDFKRFMKGHYNVSFQGNNGESGIVFWADQRTLSFRDISRSVPAVLKHRGQYLYEMTQAGLTAIAYDPNGIQEEHTLLMRYNVCMILGGLLVYGLSIKGYRKNYKEYVQKYGTPPVQKPSRNQPQRRNRRRGRGKFLRPADKGDKS